MKNKNEVTIRSSAAEYSTYIAAVGDSDESLEMRYQEENIWLTQQLMAALYDVSVPAINQHLKTIFTDKELDENSVIKKYLITAADGKQYNTKHYNLQAIIAVGFKINNDRGNELLIGAGKISAEQAKLHAETEFEKYRIVQDRLYESDFDRFVALEEGMKE
jgi:hypothetical protein